MKNKILRCTAVLLVIVSLFTVTAFAAEYVHGDVDKDGSISNSDLLLVARYYVGLSTMSDEQIKAADFNEDGEITNTDIINVARIVSGLDEGELVSDFEPILISTGNNDSTKEETKTETKTDAATETKTETKSYTDDDVYWLSRIIYAEAGGESYEGMVAVGNVVLNRVKSSKFPNTIYGVIFQKSQFTPASSGSIYRTPSATAIKAAKAALEGENVVGGALYFNAVGVSSWASRNATFVKRIGNHNFYK